MADLSFSPFTTARDAWEYATHAVAHGIFGRQVEYQDCINAMTRALLAKNATIGVIRNWETQVAISITAGIARLNEQKAKKPSITKKVFDPFNC